MSADDVYDALTLICVSQNDDIAGTRIVAPQPVHHGAAGGSQSTVEYLITYITKNFSDDRDTAI